MIKPLSSIPFKISLSLILITLLSACGGGGSGGGGGGTTPTDTNTVFQLFPSNAFSAGTSDTITLTGTDSAGGVYTGTASTQAQAESTFLGQPAIPMLVQLQLTNTANGGFVSVVGTSYYSTSASDRRYLGINITGSTSTVSATTTPIPETAMIGDFGVIGTYTDNAGNVDVQSWRLDDGGNGRAKLVQLSTETDQFGTIINSTVDTDLIDTSGNMISEVLVIFYADSGITLTLNGS